MIMKEAREQIVACGNRMIADRLTLGTSGNLSIYDPAEGLMAISPSGVAYADTKPEDIVMGERLPGVGILQLGQVIVHGGFIRRRKGGCGF